MEMIARQVRQSVCSLSFAAAVIAAAVSLALAAAEPLMTAFRSQALCAAGFHVSLVLDALASRVFLTALTLFAPLPAAAAYIDEVQSGLIKTYLPRTGRRRYLLGKYFSSLVSGGLVALAGAWVAYGLACLVFLPMEKAQIWEEGVRAPVFSMISVSACLFLVGGFWSLTGLTASALWHSRYMAVAAPFILCWLLIIVKSRYLPGLWVWDVTQWLGAGEGWPFGRAGIFLWLTELVLVMGGIFIVAASRRLSRL